MRFLSICSGIEAASVAFEPLGWGPLAFAEIAKFPRRVLAHHYPDVPLHGDFTLLRDMDWIGQADVLIGGPPCQSFSVAGLRGGLSDARGNLTLEFVRLADAIDNLRPAASPATIVYENVPGILSSKDNAFGALLAGLGGCDAPIVNTGPWPGAGVVAGPRRIVAWRVLDAQFFGVAQRRRRVFVLSVGRSAPCGGWSAADALLPISQGGGRDIAPVRETREAVAAKSANRSDDTSKWPATISPTLNAQFGSKLGLEDRRIDGGAGMFVPTLAPCLETQEGGLRHPDTQAYVVGALPASLGKGLGHNKDEFIVAAPLPGHHPRGDLDNDTYVTAFTPYAGGTQGMTIANNLAPTMDSSNQLAIHETAHTLRASGFDASEDGTGRGTPLTVCSVALRGREGGATAELGGDMAGTLRASGGGGDKAHAMAHGLVRRLTPVECERLQGFPDNYTAIPGAADGPRYAALGNSMAVPVIAWIGKQIAATRNP